MGRDPEGVWLSGLVLAGVLALVSGPPLTAALAKERASGSPPADSQEDHRAIPAKRTLPDARVVRQQITSTSREPDPTSQVVVTEEEGAGAPYAAGQFVVKFKDSLTECAHCLLKEGKRFGPALRDGSDSIDRLNRRFGVTRARHCFGDRDHLTTEQARRRAADEVRAVQQRFAKRQRRVAQRPAAIPDLTNTYVFEVSEAPQDLEAICQLYAADPHVEYAHPNYRVEAWWTPNDPHYTTAGSWGQTYDDLWGLKKIQASSAWDQSQGKDVVIAVIDTGLDAFHPDIAGNVWTNPREVAGNRLDDDRNGFVDDVQGWDFTTNSNRTGDGHGHGTHVSGTIAAVGNNGLGIIGVAPKAKILPVKALDNNGGGMADWLANAIVYAANAGADVLNNSWGCSSACPSVPIFEDAVRYANGLGTVVVFAAGNSNVDIGSFSPQNLPETIAVAAFDHNDQKASFSNYGLVDVAAPGGGNTVSPPTEPLRNILSLKAQACSSGMCPSSLIVGMNYVRQAGTSMAAPHVAGLAALVLGAHLDYSPEQVRQAIRSGSDDLGTAGVDPYAGYGRINAAKAVAHAVPLGVLIRGPVPTTATGAESIEITGTADGPDLTGWTLERGVGAAPTSWVPVASSAQPVADGVLTRWDIRDVPDGTYLLRLAATNALGETFEDRHQVTIDQVVLEEPTASPRLFFRAGQPIVIKGTAAPANFASYAIKVSAASYWFKDPVITLANGGLQKVRNGVLGTWDTTNVQLADHYSITLEVTLTNGQVIREGTAVVVDPTLHPGWPINLGRIPFSIGTLSILNHLDAADVNGDGKSELIIGYGTTVRVFDDTGKLLPGWPKPANPLYPTAYIQRSPAAADLNGDGAAEIIVPTGGSYITVWQGNGTLLPGWPKLLSAGQVVVDDMDRDGSPELIAVGSPTTVMTKEGIALPGWPKSIDPNGMTSPAIGDVDGDGKKELAFASAKAPQTLYLLRLDGTVMPGWPKPLAPTLPSNGIYLSAPAMGDLDGDKDLEIVMGTGDGTVHAFHHDGTLVAGWPQGTAGTQVHSPAIGDLDGDGQAEIVAGVDWWNTYYDGTWNMLFAWRASGARLPGWPVKYDRWINWKFFGFGASAIADVDADGRADAIASSDVQSGKAFGLNAYRFDGTKPKGFPKPTAALGASNTNTVAVADLDGDGLLELAWIDLDANLYVWDLETPAASPQPWPMFRGEARQTGRVKRPNQPPMWSPIGSKQVQEGQRLSFSVQATDADRDPVRLSAKLANGNTLSTVGASFTDLGGGTGTFSWTPTHDQAKDYQVVFSASDGEAAASALITITVINVNRAPVFSPSAPQQVKAGQALSFTVSASDPDCTGRGCPALIYSASNLPPGASFSRQLFSWTPTYAQAGRYEVTFTVSDGALTATMQVPITVEHVNRAPLLAPIGSKTGKEGDTLTFTVSASDPDGDPLTFSAANLPTGATFIDRMFRWTPAFDQAGTYPGVQFTVTDGSLTASEAITLTIADANNPPVLAPIGAKTGKEGELLTFQVTATDPDGNPLVYAAANLPAGATFSDQVFRWVPTFEQAGMYPGVRFEVTDGTLSVSEEITIVIENVNRAPVADDGAVTTEEDAAVGVRLAAHDADGDALRFAVVQGPARGTLSGTAPDLTFTPAVNYHGTDRFTFTASDGVAESNLATVSLTVTPVNDAPVAEGQAVITDEDTAKAITLIASDVDGDPLTYRIVSAPAHGSLSGAAPPLTYDPEGNFYGVDRFTFAAGDGTLESETVAVAITVNPVNDAPVLSPIGTQTGEEGELLTFTISASDVDNDPLTYTASNLPPGASFSGQVFSWTPTAIQAGTYPGVRFTVSDGQASDAEDIALTIQEAILAVSGTVRDSLGRPVSGAWVQITLPGVGRQDMSTVTDGEGRYLLTNLQASPRLQAVVRSCQVNRRCGAIHVSVLSHKAGWRIVDDATRRPSHHITFNPAALRDVVGVDFTAYQRPRERLSPIQPRARPLSQPSRR